MPALVMRFSRVCVTHEMWDATFDTTSAFSAFLLKAALPTYVISAAHCQCVNLYFEDQGSVYVGLRSFQTRFEGHHQGLDYRAGPKVQLNC